MDDESEYDKADLLRQLAAIGAKVGQQYGVRWARQDDIEQRCKPSSVGTPAEYLPNVEPMQIWDEASRSWKVVGGNPAAP